MSNNSGINTGDPPEQSSTASTDSNEFRSEFERLKTFPLSWEHHGCSKRSLATAGFYYSNNTLTCAFCDFTLNAANISDDLQEVHRAASPDCDLAHGGQSENVPLGNVNDFRFEKHRLISYLSVNWTAPVDPYDLAKWGFYYLGTDDVARCTFCRLEVRGWEQGDEGLSEHRRWSSNCPFLNGRPVGNIPLGQEHLLAERISPRYPHYASSSARLATYKLWPMCSNQRPTELAAAGFYFIGTGDRVVCFHCGGGLKDWAAGDDPWEEHAKWFSGCPYLRQMKNKSFIEQLETKKKSENKADQNEIQPRERTSSNRPKLFEEIERLKTFPKRWDLFLTISLLASSGFYYSGNNYNDLCTCTFCDVVLDASEYDTGTLQAIHLALSPNCDLANGRTTQNVALGNERNFSLEQHRLASLLSSDWPAPVDVYDLADWGLYYVGPGDNVKCFSCGVEFSGWIRGDHASATHQLCSPNCQFLRSRGITSDHSQDSETISTPRSTTITAPPVEPTTSTQGPVVEDLHGLHCRICLHRQVSVLFLPCGHLQACAECSQNVEKCPLCNYSVTARIRTFLS